MKAEELSDETFGFIGARDGGLWGGTLEIGKCLILSRRAFGYPCDDLRCASEGWCYEMKGNSKRFRPSTDGRSKEMEKRGRARLEDAWGNKGLSMFSSSLSL